MNNLHLLFSMLHPSFPVLFNGCRQNISNNIRQSLNFTKNFTFNNTYMLVNTPSHTFSTSTSTLTIVTSSTKTAQPDDEFDKNSIDKISFIINSIKSSYNFNIAFTHRSSKASNKENLSYDRLEYFGDSLIHFYTSKLIYSLYTNYKEGELTLLRTSLVNTENLSNLSKKSQLDKYLIIDKSAKISTKILADIFESFVAALYLEKGEEVLIEFLFLTIFNRNDIRESMFKTKYKVIVDNEIYCYYKSLIYKPSYINSHISLEGKKKDKSFNPIYNFTIMAKPRYNSFFRYLNKFFKDLHHKHYSLLDVLKISIIIFIIILYFLLILILI